MVELWKHLFAFIKPWSWATIAAWIAVGVTLWVASSQSRQRRRQVRQDAILDINFQSNEWINAAGTFLAHVIAYLQRPLTVTLPFALSVIEPITTATNLMDRALKSAHMTCDDFEVIERATEAELQLANFLTLLNGPHATDAAGLTAELTTVRDDGRNIHVDFCTTSEALITRGFKAYALPKGPIFRIRNRWAITWEWVKRKFGR